MSYLCRDCFQDKINQTSPFMRCRYCRSSRILNHDELDSLTIAHIDCDAFFASIEKRDNPDLMHKPVIVGGGKRGVVSTCCYIARLSGVHSAMPMFKALKACPDAVVVKSNFAAYKLASQQMRHLMQQLTPLIEPISIDEAYMDLSGTERLHHKKPAHILAELAKTIEKEIGITVSIGLSYNKFLAKMASNMNKPRGFSIIGRDEAKSFLAPLPISAIPGIGKNTNQKLRQLNLNIIGDIQKSDQKDIATKLGEWGLKLYQCAQGIDNRPINTERIRKSISKETTFERDIADYETLRKILMHLCDQVAQKLKNDNIAGQTIHLKLKNKHFKTITRAHTLQAPTQLNSIILPISQMMLKKEIKGDYYRLIGISINQLSDAALADPPDLFNAETMKKKEAEKAITALRKKFGNQIITNGFTLS